MIKAKEIISICNNLIQNYHDNDILEPSLPAAILVDDISELIKNKNLVDTIQWHLEDEVRNPNISAETGWGIKKKIDVLNQMRTDLVEQIDFQLYQHYQEIEKLPNATLNSETPAWIIDRLSILCLKIYHMEEQTNRTDANADHIKKCKQKLSVLLEQQSDLSLAFDELISDLESGKKYMKRYLQMKMYNDEHLNPVLYQSKS